MEGSSASSRTTHEFALRAAEARVLEMVAARRPLAEVLDALARAFEALADGMLASVLLVEDGRVHHGAAPSLPATWVRAVDGEPIGENRGSCGTAAWLRQPVIATDIATDPRWALYREAALAHGLRACWSVPILAADRSVLGTFALYYSEPRAPTPQLTDLATHAGHLAAVAIQHDRVERALVESEARARAIVEHALDANVQMDHAGIVTGWSRQAVAMFGWPAAEAIGRRLSDLIIPERSRAGHEAGLRRYLDTGEEAVLNRRLEVTALHRDGHEFPVELAVTPIRRGDQVTFSAFLEDLTETRRTQVALRESREHLELVYDHVVDVLFEISVEPAGYRFVSVNPSFLRTTGLQPDQVLGRFVHEVIPEPSRSLVLEKYAEALRTRQTVRWEETTPYPTGPRHGDVAVTPVFDDAGRPRFLIGSVRDVTEQRRMEREVRQLQKLEAIGRLSGGVAHDFNNILGVIVGMGHMLLRDVTDEAQRSQIEEIVHAAERGASLTRQLLAFGRKQLLQPEVLDPVAAVRQLEPMLRRLVPAHIALVTSFPDKIWRVKADPGQFDQVIINLAANARDAMTEGGTLTIALANVDVDAAFAASQPGMVPGAWVKLTVADTGHGMSEDTLRRIFEPFFTTKDATKGTGLGLPTVYGIVKQSGGEVTVHSALGRGTTFAVYLPRTLETPPPRLSRGETRASIGRGLEGLHVLLVEDEPALRRTIARMLGMLKVRVTEAGSGDEALAQLDEGAAPDLLLTDTFMPGLSGTQLLEQLRARRGDLKVLRMSGYVPGDQVDAVVGATEPFLPKPFTIRDLAAALQRATGG